jgi:hypothetical protein
MPRASLILLLVFAAAGCVLPYEPQPSPPKPVPVTTAKAVFLDYQQRYAATLAGVADRLERGDLQTADAFSKELQAGIQSARLAAFQPLSDRINDAAGNDRWEPGTAAKALRKMATEITGKDQP